MLSRDTFEDTTHFKYLKRHLRYLQFKMIFYWLFLKFTTILVKRNTVHKVVRSVAISWPRLLDLASAAPGGPPRRGALVTPQAVRKGTALKTMDRDAERGTQCEPVPTTTRITKNDSEILKSFHIANPSIVFNALNFRFNFLEINNSSWIFRAFSEVL